jgi:hypothetical protein
LTKSYQYPNSLDTNIQLLRGGAAFHIEISTDEEFIYIKLWQASSKPLLLNPASTPIIETQIIRLVAVNAIVWWYCSQFAIHIEIP